jgi:hypothetical protein
MTAMVERLAQVVLANGEKVEAGVVTGPDAEWAERMERLLGHKGEPWNWQNHQVLWADVGIGIRFYVLHRGGMPFANMMVAELSGVGILAHVWTLPQDRDKGACSQLLRLLLEDFRSRNGKALFLFTRFGSVAYRIYERSGFRSVEPGSGFMDWCATSREEFETAYFKKGKTAIEPLGWTHWPSSPALFMGGFPGVVRCAPLRLIGRRSTQAPFLHLLWDQARLPGARPQARVLRNEATTAAVGFAVWAWHPLWEDTCVVDVYCHPDYWDEAGDLLASLPLPEADRTVAYGEVDFGEKAGVLLAQGFRQTAVLKGRVPSTCDRRSFLDVAVFEKASA